MMIERIFARTPASRELAARAGRVFPGGVSNDTRLSSRTEFTSIAQRERAKWDVDGNEYRDFFGGHGAMMLGHSHPRVTEAIQRAAQRGIQFAANNPAELEWAELIQKHVRTAERVRLHCPAARRQHCWQFGSPARSRANQK